MLGCFHIQVFAEKLEASQMPAFVRNQVTLTNITEFSRNIENELKTCVKKKQQMSYSNDYADMLIGCNKDQQPALCQNDVMKLSIVCLIKFIYQSDLVRSRKK